jgi:hypothetical protein
MPLKKIIFKPGVNRENTRYTTEGGWYDSEKVRFRQGTPEKIGGWVPVTTNTFLGVCRSLWNFVTLTGLNILGIGTHLKFYLETGGAYYDITPYRYLTTATETLTNPFTTTLGSDVVTVADTGSNVQTGDIVVISGVDETLTFDGIPGSELNGRHTVTRVNADSYTIDVTTPATAGASGIGGSGITADYFYYVQALSNPYTTTSGSNVVTVTDAAHGCVTGDFVHITPSVTLNDVVIAAGQYQVSVLTANTYTIEGVGNASSSGSGGGTVYFTYEINVGPEFQIPLVGWGSGPWSGGPWGFGAGDSVQLRLWSQANFGEDLIFSPRGGNLYYWDANNTVNTRGIAVQTMYGASDVPTIVDYVLISDVSRFVFCFGCNDYGSETLDPMLIRWSDQESVTQWTPSITNQAGSLRLSHGSEIISAIQVRQEILVFTDSSIYSLQYVGAPVVWGSTLLGDNISIIGPNAMAVASGVTYWMGKDKFYKYDGRVNTLRCDLRQYIFSDINFSQNYQVFAGTNEGFNEIWWFYCAQNETAVSKYVIYNYLEDIWYYGNLERSAWLDIGLRDYPVAATYEDTLVYQENGVDDNTTGTATAMTSYITSSQFDIDDGHNFGFIWRMIPDLTFRGSATGNGFDAPQVTMTLIPLQNSGSGPNNPLSVGGNSSAAVTRIAQIPVEEFTGQVYIRVRGRQLEMKIESNRLGTQWQLGAPRIDIKPDGRR